MAFSFVFIKTHVTYVNSNTNLNLYNKKTTCIVSIKSISTHLSFIALGLLSCECEKGTAYGHVFFLAGQKCQFFTSLRKLAIYFDKKHMKLWLKFIWINIRLI